MKNQMIMKNAWEIARRGAKKFGGKVKEYFAAALKLSWSLYKAAKAKKGDLVGVAPWFLEKKFGHKSMVQQINGESTLKIVKSTDNAYFIEAIAYQGGVQVKNEFWAPKSVCA